MASGIRRLVSGMGWYGNSWTMWVYHWFTIIHCSCQFINQNPKQVYGIRSPETGLWNGMVRELIDHVSFSLIHYHHQSLFISVHQTEPEEGLRDQEPWYRPLELHGTGTDWPPELLIHHYSLITSVHQTELEAGLRDQEPWELIDSRIKLIRALIDQVSGYIPITLCIFHYQSPDTALMLPECSRDDYALIGEEFLRTNSLIGGEFVRTSCLIGGEFVFTLHRSKCNQPCCNLA